MKMLEFIFYIQPPIYIYIIYMGKSIRFHKRVQKRHTRKHKPTRKKNKMKKKYSKKQRGGNPLMLWGSVGLGAIAALSTMAGLRYVLFKDSFIHNGEEADDKKKWRANAAAQLAWTNAADTEKFDWAKVSRAP